MESFHFSDSNLPSTPALMAEVPAGIRAAKHLLEELARCLHFPDYFGENWNALEECIRDLSWLPAGPVVLRHHDLPLAGNVSERKTYLSILKGAVEKRWTVPGQQLRDLVVVFPPEMREQIASLLQ